MDQNETSALDRLRSLFDDRPELLDIVTLADAESREMRDALREQAGLFVDPISVWASGRTGAGKTSLGNCLFGVAVMNSTGHTDCTSEIGMIELRSNLRFVDTPGGGSEEDYENMARAALALPLLPDEPVAELTLRDYTPMLEPGCTFSEEVVPIEAWRSRTTDLAPDVVVFFVAPHLQFVRADRGYLEAVLREYGDKVVVVFNLFRQNGRETYTPQNLADARSGVERVYRKVAPCGSLTPRIVEVNALTGAGLEALTSAVCACVPAQRIGRIESVLTDELKPQARRERDRGYRHALHSIAARLALTQVDYQAWGQDLLSLAAAAVAQYTAATYGAVQSPADRALRSALADRAGEIRSARTEPLTSQRVRTQPRDLFRDVPEYETVERTLHTRTPMTRTVEESMPQGVLKAAGAVLRAVYDHAETFLSGGGTADHDKVTAQMRRELNPTAPRTVTDWEDTPLHISEQRVVGSRQEKIDTITEVVEIREEEVGQRALRGGVAVVEFLLGTGEGIREHFVDAPGVPVLDCLARQTQRVAAGLAPLAGEIEELTAQGSAAESRIVAVLDERFTR